MTDLKKRVSLKKKKISFTTFFNFGLNFPKEFFAKKRLVLSNLLYV